MSMEDFFKDAFSLHSDSISYFVNRKLAELNPGSGILYSDESGFDLMSYARAGKCSLTTDTAVHNLFKSEWRGKNKSIRKEPQNAWYNVLWRGKLFDVVFLSWLDEGYITSYFWIIGESTEIAGEYMDEVCEWSTDVRGEI